MMATDTKKVILFIAEGPTDEYALSPVLKKIFQNSHVRFHVVHGDLTSDFTVDNSNAVKTVNSHIKMELDRYGFKRSDIIRVIHLIDTDGAFIPNANVVAGDVEHIQYEENQIVTKSVLRTIARNEQKQRVLYRLSSEKMIGKSPYAVYYFSRNMEHVLHNDARNLSDEEKANYADEFADTYSQNPEGFIEFLSDFDFAVPGDYGETWRFIFAGTNSLHRHSNLHLLFSDV